MHRTGIHGRTRSGFWIFESNGTVLSDPFDSQRPAGLHVIEVVRREHDVAHFADQALSTLRMSFLRRGLYIPGVGTVFGSDWLGSYPTPGASGAAGAALCGAESSARVAARVSLATGPGAVPFLCFDIACATL